MPTRATSDSVVTASSCSRVTPRGSSIQASTSCSLIEAQPRTTMRWRGVSWTRAAHCDSVKTRSVSAVSASS